MKNHFKFSACVIVLATYIFLLVLQPFSVVTFLIGALVCNWLANLVHELGHLLAYRLLKLEWLRMRISFFEFDAKDGFRFDGDQRIYAASCTCSYHPQIPLWRYDLALMSGGLFGIVVAGAGIILSLNLSGNFTAFLQCFGVVGAVNALYNLLFPFSPDRILMKQIRQERENAE